MKNREGAAKRYEVVIGLEVHTHLRTASKLFSPAPVRYGEAPNCSVHVIDLGLPGVLPVLNDGVLDLAIRFGLATHCRINRRSVFARKNYFYPDLPKGYQISQYDEPIVSGGWLEIEVEPAASGGATSRRIGITRAHLEEDAGKSIHGGAAGFSGTRIDLNRSGVPLLEIVSEPDLRSAAEAGSYLRALRQILRYLEVSEADMERGQFRCDVNVSLRPWGQPAFGTRTELKNVNSFRFVEEGIAAEVERQAAILDAGGRVIQATVAYDAERHRTSVLREKENPDDYRYFADPDLIPLQIPTERIEKVRASLPELPDQTRARFRGDFGLSDRDARRLAESRELATFYEAAATAHGDAKAVANWIARDLMQALKERELELAESRLTPTTLAALLGLVDAGRLTARSARQLLPELVARGGDPEAMMRERGLEAVQDADLIEGSADRVLAANPVAVEKYRGGDAKTLNFLIGQIMRETRGKANPEQVRAALARKLGDRSNGDSPS